MPSRIWHQRAAGELIFPRATESAMPNSEKGLVIEVKGNVASIMFDSVGLKKLAKDIAPIKKL